MKQKKVFGLIILLYFALTSSAQNKSINLVDSNGKRQGEWHIFYKSGQIKYNLFFKDGLYHGCCTLYHRKGPLKEVMFFDNGQLLLYKTFHNRGRNRGKTKKINGLKFDKTKSKLQYSIDSSIMQGDFNKLDTMGQKNGLWYESIISAILPNHIDFSHFYCTGTYTNGRKEGIWCYYLYDGKQLMYKCNYQNNELNGKVFAYYKNGSLNAEYTFIDNKKNGEYVSYYINGKISTKASFENDKYVGEYFYYNRSGKLKKYIKDTKKENPYR